MSRPRDLGAMGASTSRWRPLLILVQSLRAERRVVLPWAAGSSAIAAGIVLASGPLLASGRLADLARWVPGPARAFLGIERLATPAQLLDAFFFGFVAPILFLTFAIGVGSRAFPRGDERTSLRRQPGLKLTWMKLIPVKVVALSLGALLIATAMWIGVMVAGFVAGQPYDPRNVAAGVAADFLLGVGMGALAMLVGAATARPALAGWVATAFAVGADAANSTGAAIPNLAVLRYLSVVYYAAGGEPAVHGVTVAHLLVLSAVAVAFTLAGGIALQRRAGAA